MIKVENIQVCGWEMALHGMRNPLNSWAKSDSKFYKVGIFELGKNDLDLACRLIKAGPEHRKFLRMIHVQTDITAPTYWWAEADTYKIATVRNSCSKMHKIHARPFELDDFAHEGCMEVDIAKEALINTINACEQLRLMFNETRDRKYWRALIELLPEGYMLKATWDGSLETVLSILKQRDRHKLHEEWEPFRQAMFNHIPYCKEFYNAMTGANINE